MLFTPSIQKIREVAGGQRPQVLFEVLVVVGPDPVERRPEAPSDRAPS